MFYRNRRLHRQSGGRRGLDRRDDRAAQGLDDALVRGQALSSSSSHGHGGKKPSRRIVFLRAERLLPRRLAGLADVPRDVSPVEKALYRRRSCPVFRLRLGGGEARKTSGLERVDAI